MRNSVYGLCFSAFALTLVAQAQPQEPAIFRAPLQPLTPSKRGVIFKADLARQFGRQCSRRSPSGAWSALPPTKVEIARLERGLPQWMKSQKMPRWKGHFSDYYFQYGALTNNKRRFIYVNALPASTEDKKQVWRRGPEVVCDGGPNFWGVEFDVQRGKFLNPDFNGMA